MNNSIEFARTVYSVLTEAAQPSSNDVYAKNKAIVEELVDIMNSMRYSDPNVSKQGDGYNFSWNVEEGGVTCFAFIRPHKTQPCTVEFAFTGVDIGVPGDVDWDGVACDWFERKIKPTNFVKVDFSKMLADVANKPLAKFKKGLEVLSDEIEGEDFVYYVTTYSFDLATDDKARDMLSDIAKRLGEDVWYDYDDIKDFPKPVINIIKKTQQAIIKDLHNKSKVQKAMVSALKEVMPDEVVISAS